MTENQYLPAIEGLEKKLEESERLSASIRLAINLLCETAGMSLRYDKNQTSTSDGQSSTITQIGTDTFYGKPQQTAIREYLGMRKAQALGPAKPKEIYDALVTGGYKFEAKDAHIAMVGIRALLRKRYNIFHKLPNGTYGLTAWYPNAKAPKQAESTTAEPQDNEDSADE